MIKMKIVISKEAMDANNTFLAEVLTLLIIHFNINVEKVKEELIKKGLITHYAKRDTLFSKGYCLSQEAVKLIENLQADSVVLKKERNLESLAKELKTLFPKGMKLGTSICWTEGVSLIVKRLKRFFDKYDKDNKYTDEEIIDATKRYIESFNGDYSYMRTLKYFIWAEKVNKAGEVESTSDLLTYLDNKGEENIQRDIGVELV